jgi:hypothetical protein
MWVKARKREKSKEKCVNRATFLTARARKADGQE